MTLISVDLPKHADPEDVLDALDIVLANLRDDIGDLTGNGVIEKEIRRNMQRNYGALRGLEAAIRKAVKNA